MLKDAENNRVTDFRLAKKIAVVMSARQQKKRNRLAAEFFGVKSSTEHTLSDLFDRRHADLGPSWSVKYAKSRELRKTFWLERLGEHTPLVRVTAAAVERVARDAQGALSDRWRQDVLRYMVDSFAYAEKKLKWIDARHNLSAVTIPSVRGASKAYSLAEAKRLLPALAEVHPVAGWMGAVAFQTGRRIGAIRTLEPSDVERSGDMTVIRFPGETDKARRTGEAVVYVGPRTDWTVPAAEAALDWLRAAEKAAGVATVPGRGWHGLKRLYATLTTGMSGADRQSGTRKETLEAHYRQDVLEPKAEVAKALVGRLT